MADIYRALLFVALPGITLLAAIVLSTYRVYQLRERTLLLLIAILALMLQHQLLEALTILETGGVGEPMAGELLETGANLLAAGSVYYVLSFARREQQLVERYERSRDQYQQLLAATPVAILIYCEGTVRFANEAAIELFDADGEADLVGRQAVDLVADTDEAAFLERVREGSTADSAPKPMETALRTLSGDRRYGLMTATPARFHGEDAVQVVVQDITDRKHARVELAETRRRLQTIVDSIHDAILVVDLEEEGFIDCNPRACELLGYTEAELIEMHPSDIHPQEYDAYKEFVDAVREAGAVQTDTLSCRRKDGRTLDAEVAGTTTEIDGSEALLVSIRDVSERRRRERQIQLLQRVLRHNIRNDMTSIINRAGVVETEATQAAEQDESDIGAAVAERLAEQGRRIRAIAKGLVETSEKIRTLNDAIDRERRTLSTTTDLATHVEHVLDRVETETDTHCFERNVPETAPVRADESLRWAVENLVENAVEHTPPGTTVRVSIEVDEPRNMVTLVVADDGPGIPDDERSVVTRESDPDQITHGSGIGLWVVAQLAAAFDADLSITTNKNGFDGTIVELRLPGATLTRPPATSTAEG